MPRGIRPLQVGRQVWQSLTRYLNEHSVDELQAKGMLTLTRVQMSGDLKRAKVFYRWYPWETFIQSGSNQGGDSEVSVAISMPSNTTDGDFNENLLDYELSPTIEKKINETLKAYAPKLQSYLAKDLDLRFTPRLQFVYDRTYSKTLRVERTLKDLHKSSEQVSRYDEWEKGEADED